MERYRWQVFSLSPFSFPPEKGYFLPLMSCGPFPAVALRSWGPFLARYGPIFACFSQFLRLSVKKAAGKHQARPRWVLMSCGPGSSHQEGRRWWFLGGARGLGFSFRRLSSGGLMSCGPFSWWPGVLFMTTDAIGGGPGAFLGPGVYKFYTPMERTQYRPI